ncbi:MAG: hypothetical protein JKX97_00395 [Candidatus Lindowbacteria bacterium]|nr:hypothetical protein [Candidatus Lindowbacteria bacterium]
MNYIIYLYGSLLIAGGLMLAIKPGYFVGPLKSHIEEFSLYILAIGLRLLFGVVLVFAAESSKFPVILSVIGYITLLAAAILVVMGHTRFKSLMAWALDRAMKHGWASGLFTLLLGVFIIYAVA